MNSKTPEAISPTKLTFIVPVFNRPDELRELLTSLANQTDSRFELVVVEDGSTLPSTSVIADFSADFDISYLVKTNSGPGPSRNFGCKHSLGDFFVFVDSDCVLPPNYVAEVLHALEEEPAHAFGGPDAASEDFSPLQKAINHAMTSFFTTGGIRGGSERVAKFLPRSFNMGFSRKVFEQTGGFPEFRFAPAKAAGEDLDLSYTINEMGFQVRRLVGAFVWHKRRTSWKQFIKQVYSFGYARITVSKRHPGTLKIIHVVPAAYTISLALFMVLAAFTSPVWLIPHGLHACAVGVEAGLKNKSLQIGLLSVFAGILQLTGYGVGFLRAVFAPKVFVTEKP